MSLEMELQAERVAHLNLSGFSKATSETHVRDALRLMRDEKHNVCLVTENGKLVGIFTDRDVLLKVAGSPNTWDLPISQLMTPDPVTVSADTSAADALWLMDEKHFRNLPVIGDDGEIVGNMTHNAVIVFLASRYPIEVLNRPPRPEQFPRKAEGG